jgi:hypothetical protein
MVMAHIKIMSRVLEIVNGVLDWMIEFIAPYTHSHSSGLQTITELSMFYTLSSSPFHTH